ncbi:WD40 repeat protein [Fulvivirga imtechensis AK7]|uniref:WD40 repeat protein n=1 Tax=Fulvivirga imtechensis AK7 TaxID=1237149 RepID=L8JP45_9BACT|nr:caspase family protein [Fulvivirga imtechensis]ELR70726.1 WD40 repeat protein [Fulvivirga imtechensis AK7]
MKTFTILVISIICTTQLRSQKLETVVQRGHYEAIKAVTFTPDGKNLLTASRDKSIKLWDVASGRELRSFLGHSSTVNDLDVSNDGKYFVSSGADKVARLWEIETGRLIRTFRGHNDLLTTVDLSGDGKQLITAGYDWVAILWDVTTGDTLRTFKVNPDKGLGYGIDARFTVDDRLVAFGADNRTTTVYHVKTGELVQELKPAEGWCGGCATFVDYSDNGEHLITASNKGDFVLRNSKSGEILQTFESNWETFRAIDISPHGEWALMLGEDSLKTYDVATGRLKYAIRHHHKMPATDATFSPDNRYIVTVGDDQKVHLYDAGTGKLLHTLGGYLATRDKGGLDYDVNSRWDYYIKKYTDLKHDFAVSPDGKYLLKGKVGKIARMWEINSGKIVQEFYGHDKAVLCMAFTKDGKKVVTGSADNTVKIWETGSGKELITLKGHREVIFSVALSPDEKKIITGSWDGTAKIWDTSSGKLLQTLTFENSSPYQIGFFKNDIYAYVAGLDKSFKLYELDAKLQVQNYVGHTDVIQAFAVHPNSHQVASVSWDGKLKVWNAATGLQEWRISSEEPLYSVSYSGNGQYLAFGGGDRVLRVVNSQNGDEVKELTGHKAAITNIRFSQNDKLLISASEDGMIKIWDINDGKELISYILLENKDWMAINSEGYFNASDGAFDKIAFVKGMKSYGAGQFFEQFFQPDLLDKTFSSAKDERLNLHDKIKKSPPPLIEIITPHQGEAFRNNEAEVMIKVTDAGGGVDEVKVLHNGKLVNTQVPDVPKGKSALVTCTLRLIPGSNAITVSAFSRGRIESERQEVKVGMEGKVNSTLYVVAVGINKYKNEALNLNYAAADAKGFIKSITEKSKKLFDRIEVIPFYDEEATRQDIMSKLDVLSKIIKPQDVLFFYYAGHGSMVDNDFYFIPTDNVQLYNEEKLKKNAIYAGDLQDKLAAIPALKQLIIIDACQSGGSVELLAQRGAGEEKALAQLSRSTGIHVLAAAGSEQFAIEFTELGHGLFTYVLLEALSGKADGAPQDGKITIYELKSYLDDQVPEFSKKFKGKLQFPYTFSRGHDFPVVID